MGSFAPVSASNIPCITTATTEPLNFLEQHILKQQLKIEAWFRQQWQNIQAPITTSVDLRNAGFKLANVDTNLFPAGFNNLNLDFLPLCVQALQNYMLRYFPRCQRLLLIPENHTRNIHYWENLAIIYKIISMAGYDVRIGSLLPELETPKEITLPSGASLTLFPVSRQNNRIYTEEYNPCLILSNNDFSEGIPEILKDLDQKILPPLIMGWASRSKSTHFSAYQDVSERFATLLEIDPWLITPLYRTCEKINFVERQGEECLMSHLEDLFSTIKAKYLQYNIKQEPFVVIKADAGTYGMGILMVKDPQQILQLNRKERQRMATAKGGSAISKVILQEGIPTCETWGNPPKVAEPVVYMIGPHVVGGFYRVHNDRGKDENLNSPGMHFETLAFMQSCNIPDAARNAESYMPNRFYVYSVIARLSALAAAFEEEKYVNV